MAADVGESQLAGAAHYAEGRYEAALRQFQAALKTQGHDPRLHFRLGNTLRHLGRPREAISAYDAALALAPAAAIVRHNRATCLLQVGDFAAGFREYEWRKVCPDFAEDPRYRLERPWRGEDLQGKTLYVYRELYQGDLIQFGRYAALAEQLGARVVLSAPVAMHALLRTMSPTLSLAADDAPAPAYDYNSALMTLPAMFGTTLETVPGSASYLAAEPARVEKWRRRIGDQGFRIGLAWQGSARAEQRSFPLQIAAGALAGVPGARLIGLQKHSGLDQLAHLRPGLVETLGDDFDPGPDLFLDTAAAMLCCDLFVTLDTSVAHLAGALGVTTWLALPHVADWRWLQDRTDTPWYPSVRIFRQPAPGDWAGVFERMADALSSHPPL